VRAFVLLSVAVVTAVAIGTAAEASTTRPPLLTSVAVPGCSTAVNDGPAINSVQPRFLTTGGSPFGVAVARTSDEAFVSTGAAIDVFSLASKPPRLIGEIGVGGEGDAVTPDGKDVLVAQGDDVAIVATALNGSSTPGSLTAPGTGAIEVAVAPDGSAAFVSLEDSAAIAVFRLHETATGLHGDYVGEIRVGLAPVGLAFSPDGKWLYSTSEGGGSLGDDQGSLRVIDVDRAETDPAHSVVATVDAGCEPVRVAVSPDGTVVWVTARASDALLGFSAARVLADRVNSLVADVRVGEAPVGLAVANNGATIVVADSNRFNVEGAHANLLVVDTSAALAHRPAVLGHIKSGFFPRDMAVTPNGGSVLVANFESGQLEEVGVATLTHG
jgi:DNA-binding beta-propeller fold protein YncE